MERLPDGSEVHWGTILRIERPNHFEFSWHPGRNEETAQVVTLRFAEEDQHTRIDLTHYGWEKLGEEAARARNMYDGGWVSVLGEYVA